MRSSELYYLIFVCASFSVMALALGLSTIRYNRWVKATAQAAPAQSAPKVAARAA